MTLRERVWSAQHDLTCDEKPAHPWSDHLPWDDAETEAAAVEEADAIIGVVLAEVRAADATLRSEVERIVGNGESWARYHAYPVLVAVLAAIDKVDRSDPLRSKDISMAEYSDTRSACPSCGEWRDSPTADCAGCGLAAIDKVADTPPIKE